MKRVETNTGQRYDRDSQKPISPEQFDNLVREGAIPQNLLRAWCVMPLSRYKDDLKNVNMEMPHWIQMRPTEVQQTGFAFWKKTREVFSPFNLFEGWKQLRRFYGWQSGMSDLLRNEYPDVAAVIYGGEYSSVVHLARLYTDFAPLDSWEKVYALVEEGNTHPNSKSRPQDIEKSTNLLRTAMPSLKLIDEVFAKAAKRQGIQVVYGGDAFKDYCEYMAGAHIDSAVWNARRLDVRTPSSYITAVVPLGTYEQAELLSK